MTWRIGPWHPEDYELGISTPAAQHRDHPLSCNWRPVAPDAFDVLSLPPASSKAMALTRAQIIAEAFVVGRADPEARISYSRSKEFYRVRPARYGPTNYSCSTVVATVDQLTALGLLDHRKMPAGNFGWQSSFKASSDLIRRLNEMPLPIVHDPHETIVLRDADGNLIDYTDTRRTEHQRRNMTKINEMLAATAIGLHGRPVHPGEPLEAGNVRFGAVSQQLRRIFNNSSFGLGGRMYGGFWQNIPSEHRAGLTIDGCLTIELDFPRLHPTLLYAEVRVPMAGDPYALPDWPRNLVKMAFNTLVNAETRIAAVRAIAYEIAGEGAYKKALRLVDEIKHKHAPISQFMGTGAGLRLQRRDSDIAEDILLKLARRGIFALPIHDSFIVSKSNKGELMNAMANALHRHGDPAAALGCIVVFFPEGDQRSLFGDNSPAVPASDLFGWTGGHAPEGVRRAMRYELDRRHMRPADLAKSMGISRPQLVNIMRDRFGASPEIADRIRAFLIEGARTTGSPTNARN
jgi:hypothetical protein